MSCLCAFSRIPISPFFRNVFSLLYVYTLHYQTNLSGSASERERVGRLRETEPFILVLECNEGMGANNFGLMRLPQSKAWLPCE